MHEFSLHGQVSRENGVELRRQLAGLTRMQPVPVLELHLIFRARIPQGVDRLPSGGGSQGVVSQDMQRLKSSLNASLYYVQMVGALQGVEMPGDNEDNLNISVADKKIEWSLEFMDTPEAGKQPVSMRLASRTQIEHGDTIQFMQNFGYEFVSRYVVRGYNFYDQDITLFLHQVLKATQVPAHEAPALKDFADLSLLDESGSYNLQAVILVADGNSQELRDRTTKQLLAMRDVLKPAIVLTPGDRLALDTKVPATFRR